MMFQTRDKDRRAVAMWLLFMAALVFTMVVVGGATRLTESGLSIVDWRPVTGVLPPIGQQEWQAEFAKYQTSPEYKLKNYHMSLEDFKGIFYWEWAHRLLGRLIGLFFFVPMVWFWARGRVPHGYKPRLVMLFILGGLQGVLGWYMVKSGLVDEPAVSHYRLTAHLSLALLIFAALFWTALSLLNPAPERSTKKIKRLSHIAALVLVLQIVMGALVAGLKAGHIFNTWPLMGDTFVPEGLLAMEPTWRNFFDNAITTQFDHRIGAYLLTALTFSLLWCARGQSYRLKKGVYALTAAVVVQMFLGITMLLKEVPVSWGTAHQGGGVLVLAAIIYLMHMQRGRTAE
ncbi:COX15/CtaA family protein [Kordiimonas aestuarii]|uniref:COX15/CtaA family protein n=1 Tax=Kordiimonas aestuarii TaxID=1005925 RepID=UPI0021CF623F|nr:COX15/CtaA family protein [Kordiimonas aestuarii]